MSNSVPATRKDKIVDFLGLERNIVAVSIAMFLMGLGEELWKRFLPKYMQALGAPVIAIGSYGTELGDVHSGKLRTAELQPGPLDSVVFCFFLCFL